MKIAIVMFQLISLILILTACVNYPVAIDSSADTSPTASTVSEANLNVSDIMSTTSYEDTTSSDNSTAIESIDAMFIGNSLTYVGKIPEKFTALCEQEGKSVNVKQKTNGGYNLSQQLAELQGETYKNIIPKIDIVIMQEYGSYGLDTANSVIEIQKLFKEGTKFYFLLTEFDVANRLNELQEVENITYIPSGYAHNLLIEKGITYERLHAVEDYHPNSLYGYLATLAVYSTVFDIDCVGLSYDFLDSTTIAQIPGTSKEEKAQSVTLIQETVMEALELDLTAYE